MRISDWSSDVCSSDRAAAASGLELEAVAVRGVAPGAASRPWTANVVGVGEASAAFDPLNGFALHGLQLGLVHLIASFPADGAMAARRGEYNRLMTMHVARVRSEEHTSELQSLMRTSFAVFCLNTKQTPMHAYHHVI